MPLSALTDKTHEPTEDEVRIVLGKAHVIWNELIGAVAERLGSISQVWGYTSKTTGWGLRVKQNDRIILYMTPQAGKFLVSFALGEKAVAEAKSLKLSQALLAAIEAAPRYAEGRGLRLEISSKRLVTDLAKLAQIKSEN